MGGVLFWALAFGLLWAGLVHSSTTTVTSFESQKNYYSSPADPGSAPSRPSGSHGRPSHGSSSHTPHGSSNCGGPKPPSPSSCHHCTPSNPPPSPPSGGCGCPSPSPPSGGGGYYSSPPPSTPPLVPVLPPVEPGTPPAYSSPPLVPSPPLLYSPPVVPVSPSNPYTPAPPLVPVSPVVPSPPFPFDPNTPPFPCTYWRSHPGLVAGLLGWWGTLGGLFGVASPLPGLHSTDFTIHEALANTQRDGYGSLYREGSAALLNSIATSHFPFSTQQVKSAFLTALSSAHSASAQARFFRLANEGRLHHHHP